MKKFKIAFTLIVCITIMCSYFANRSSDTKEFPLTLTNLEALASGEDGGSIYQCNSACLYDPYRNCSMYDSWMILIFSCSGYRGM